MSQKPLTKKNGAPEKGSSGTSRKNNREKLMQAALQLLLEDQSGLSGLSLRKITGQCGLSPPAFYNHFDSTETLGLALINELGEGLSDLLRTNRASDSLEDIVARSVQNAFHFIRQEPAIFTFISRERAGSSAAIREAIREVVSSLTDDMARDFQQRALFPNVHEDNINNAVAAVISLALGLIPDVLDADQRSFQEAELLVKAFEKQVMMVFMGLQQT